MDLAEKSVKIEKALTPTMEDYLEAIFNLDIEKKAIRVKDIATKMNVKMPTVTNMLKILSERGFINYEKYEYVEMTEEGARIGREMQRRHAVFLKFLTEVLRIDFKTANEEACRMEHTLSLETMASLTDFIEFIQSCPRAGESWINNFEQYRKQGMKPERCIDKIDQFTCDFAEKVSSVKKIKKQKNE